MKKKSLAWNSFIYSFKSILGILFPLITFPYVTNVLGPENIGRVEYANSITNYFIFLAALGITTYAIRTGAPVKKDRRALSKLATEMFVINCVSAVVAYIGVFTVCRINFLSGYGILILINSITILCNTIGMEWVYNVVEDFTYITIRYIVVHILAIVFLFVFVKEPEDYIWYSLYILLANGGSGIVNAVSLRKYVDLFSVKFRELELCRHVKPIFLLFSISIVSTIFANLDTTMLGAMCGDREVGLYQAGMKIDRVVMGVLAAVSTVMFARVSASGGKDQSGALERLLKNFNGVMMLIAAPLSFGLSCISLDLADFLFADGFAKSGIVLMIISINILNSAVGRVYGHQVLLSRGEDTLYFWITAGSLLINVVINLALIPTMGCIAAAISTVVSNTASACACVFFASKYISVAPMLRDTVKYSLIACVFFGIEYLLRCALGRNTIQMFVTIFVCAVSYAGALLLTKDKYLTFVLGMVKGKIRRRNT